MTTLIGISGPSSSGKSTVARAIALRFSGQLLEQDRYFVDPDNCLPDSNFCDPQFLKEAEFLEAVRSVSDGLTAEVPEIDFATFRQTGVGLLDPAQTGLVIVEGMTIFRYEDVLSRLTRAYYLKASIPTILTRKMRRDVSERGKTEAHVHTQMRWVSSELAFDERRISSGVFAPSEIVVVDAEDVSAATDAIGADVASFLERT